MEVLGLSREEREGVGTCSALYVSKCIGSSRHRSAVI